MPDNWKHRSQGMRCKTCMYFVPKVVKVPGPDDQFWEKASINSDPPTMIKFPGYDLGRCRRHAPTMNGWPVVFVNDWCGDHKIDEEKFSAHAETPTAMPNPLVARDLRIETIDFLVTELLKARGYVCIHDRKEKMCAYCDDCPLGGSMIHWTDFSNLACRKTKHYSK